MRKQIPLRLDKATEKLAEEGRRRRGSRSLNAYLVELIIEDSPTDMMGALISPEGKAATRRLLDETKMKGLLEQEMIDQGLEVKGKETADAGASKKAEGKRAVRGGARGRGAGGAKGKVRGMAAGTPEAMREPGAEESAVLPGPSGLDVSAGPDEAPVGERAEAYRLETASGTVVEGGPMKASPASARINQEVEPIAFKCRMHRTLWCPKTECVTEKQENEARGVKYLR